MNTGEVEPLFKAESQQIAGAAMEVLNEIGHGFPSRMRTHSQANFVCSAFLICSKRNSVRYLRRRTMANIFQISSSSTRSSLTER